MPGTVAITGATGFIGSHVLRRFAGLGWRVRILTRRPPLNPIFAEAAFEAVLGDLQDERALGRLLQGATAVVHCAGLIKARSRAEFDAVNATATGRLAALAAARPEPPRFVLLSSLAAREPGLSDYAASKRAGETAVAAAAGAMPWLAIRPPIVYGPGDRETLPMFRSLARGRLVLPRPRGRISLIHAEDLAAAIAAAAACPLAGVACEVDDGRPGGYDWREFAAIAAAAAGVPFHSVPLPRPVVAAAGLASHWVSAMRGRPAIFGPGKVREMFHPDWVCRPSPLQAEGWWQPRIGLAEGVAGTLAWYRAQGWV
ncbi:MAG: NAD-dependent epimerase/dehydratase family protein [Dongiaceae bacterium]